MSVPAWKQVLIDAKYPTDVLVLDFESYFDTDFSLKIQSTIEHIMDDRFELLGVSTFSQHQNYAECTPMFWSAEVDNWDGEAGVHRHLEFLQGEYGKNLEGCTFVSHNAYYETAILALKFGIFPPFNVDTMGLHRHINARAKHSLEYIAKEQHLPEKGDTKFFKDWTFRTRRAKPSGRGKAKKIPKLQPKINKERLCKLADYANHDVELEYELFTRFLPRLSNSNFELKVMQHTIKMWTQPTLTVDYKFAEELATKMEAQADKFVEVTGQTAKDIRGTNSFEALLINALAGSGEAPPYKQGTVTKANPSGLILAVAKDDIGREFLLNHKNDYVRSLMEARAAIKSWPTHAKRVRAITSQCKASNDKLCVPLKYYGAHTGRWSGGEGINLQNLSKRNIEDLINQIRGIIIAPPGYCLVIVDASQIEARNLAWEAGQLDLCQRFADGEEIYAGFASRVLGKPVRKPRKTDPKPVYEKHEWARNAVGKTGVLGCGYGMGWRKVIEYTKGLVDEDTAKLIVETYRKENDKIVQYWQDVSDAFAVSVKYGKEQQIGHIRFFPEPDHPDITVLELPSGRWIRYHKPVVKGIGYKRELRIWNPITKSYDHIWGGHLTENLIQATSRDLLAYPMIEIEEKGYPVALTVHDEVITVVPIDDGPKVLEFIIDVMSTPPSWAEGCPLAAEGCIASRYGE